MNIRLEDEQTATVVAIVVDVDVDDGRAVEVGRQAMKAILDLGYGAGWSRIGDTLTVSVLAPLRQGERLAIDWERVADALRKVSGVVGAPVVRQLGDVALLRVAA